MRKKSIIYILLLVLVIVFVLELNKEPLKESALREEIVLTNLVTKNGKTILEAYPGGNYVAGTPSGCWWNIYLPFEEIKMKTLKITAVHLKTNNQITEIELEKIEDKGFKYDDFTRVSTEFNIPFSGVWEFHVNIDDTVLGNVTFDIP